MSAIAQPVTASAARPTPKSSGWRHLKLLLPYVKRYKGMVALGLLALTLTGLVGAFPQLIIGTITDCLQASPQPLSTLSGSSRAILHPLFSFYAPLSVHALGLYCLILVVVMLVKGFFSFWTRWILIGVSREIEYDLRNDLLARLLVLDPEFYGRNRTGDLMSRVTNDLNAVRMVLGPGIMYTANTIATSVLAVYFMVRLSAGLTAWVLLPVPLVVVSVWYFGQIIHRLSEQIQAALGVLSTRAQENLTGIRVIRAYGQEQPQIEAFDQANRDYVDRNVQLIGSWSLFFPALSTLIGLTVIILLAMGGIRVINQSVSLGTFLAFYTFLIQLVFPMIAIGFVTNIFQRGAASIGRLNYILAAKPRIADPPHPANDEGADGGNNNGDAASHAAVGGARTGFADASIRGEIDFRHLDFAYPAGAEGALGPLVLRDINLHVPGGSTLAIVGPTGSGKSTLAGLIGRLWDVPRGELLIDGRSIRDYLLEILRRSIGYVPQDTFLFSETIRENIAFGVEGPDQPEARLEDRILEAAEIANISGEIQSFPSRFDTMVGERGITLSGGQKQRTALARAILRQPRILILDDALSSVDTDTEERILGRLREVMRRRTTIVIAHRISTVKNADQIVVLRDGQIIERGTHDELLTLAGYYADLYQKQLLEEELERE